MLLLAKDIKHDRILKKNKETGINCGGYELCMCYVYYKKYYRNNFFCVRSVWPWCVLGYVTIMYWVCHHNIRLVSSWYNNCWSITRLLSTSNKNVIRLTFLSEEWTEIANNQKIPVSISTYLSQRAIFNMIKQKIITYYLLASL